MKKAFGVPYLLATLVYLLALLTLLTLLTLPLVACSKNEPEPTPAASSTRPQ